MILGKPSIKLESNFICVNSDISQKLCEMGFEPFYREIKYDNVYFLKTKEIESVVREWQN